ncbi:MULTISPECIES: hypothetical protein [Kitasatospora]|uniref:ESAT-6-like protein n=1 Tax=Kitasatospora setae (strain ATCC 33774 / DSM 43861 / JCM 3304 / KCC A-0304 / NBRC 14216 / KM-6054) TaxID=452652 RepID=E4NFV1_KITSK|nr:MULTISPECIES: hypothetical protein [Kitasatospora]BAJ30381.1 hypothetical protein KSE_46000 [Kitasatospora setae KM-6054]
MGAYFRVEVDELSKLMQQLKDSQQDMREALRAMRDTGPKTTGTKDLDRACDDFDDSWQDAITRISQGVEALEAKLDQTCKNYGETEEALRAMFSGSPA